MNKEKIADIGVFTLRVITGLLFLQHGGMKLFGWFTSGSGGMELPTLVLIAGILELVGGAAIVLGLFTRPVAFVLSGQMAVAYFIAHASRGPLLSPIENGGELAVLFCFIFLFFAAYGAGKWSIDDMWSSRGQNTLA